MLSYINKYLWLINPTICRAHVKKIYAKYQGVPRHHHGDVQRCADQLYVPRRLYSDIQRCAGQPWTPGHPHWCTIDLPHGIGQLGDPKGPHGDVQRCAYQLYVPRRPQGDM